jgi:hypothetical protein
VFIGEFIGTDYQNGSRCQAFVLRIVIIQRLFPSTNLNQVAGPRSSLKPQLNDKIRGCFRLDSATSYSVLKKPQQHRRYGGIWLFVYAPARRIVIRQGKPVMTGSGYQHIFD